MKIVAVEAIPLAVPFSHGGAPQGWGGRAWSSLDMVLVRVETDAGITGYGEAFSYGCRRAVTAAVRDMVAPLAVGRELDDIAGLSEELQRELHLFGRYGITLFAISGLDIALWDIAAKAEDVPLSRLWTAATAPAVPCYASLFKYLDAEVVAEQTARALTQGYRSIKLHERDLPEVRAARAAAGPEIPLMLDVNCVWSFEHACTVIPGLMEIGLHWLEEPIWPPENHGGLAELRRLFGVSIAAGENASTAWQFEEMFRAGAVDFAQPSVTKVGGIGEFRAVARLAAREGVPLAPHSPYFGPGFLATLHLAAALPEPPPVERFFLALEASLYGDAIEPEDGALRLPPGAGLGIEPDPDVIRDFSIADE